MGFYESIKDTNEASRLRKVLSKDPIILSSIRRLDDSWTEFNSETMDLLMRTHLSRCRNLQFLYPPLGSSTVNTSPNHDKERTFTKEDIDNLNMIITEEKIASTIHSNIEKWCVSQHAYLKSKSVESVLHVVMRTIKNR